MSKRKFGVRKSDNATIYLSEHSWDCSWYWGFGYLGNYKEHYHLSSYQEKTHSFTLKDGSYKNITEKRNKNMYDCLLEDYDLVDSVKDNLWEFCELVQTAYTLKETAEMLGRGGSHFTTNPHSALIINKDETKRINTEVLPEIMKSIYNMLIKKVTDEN